MTINEPMTHSTDEHHVFIVNEAEQSPFATPDVLPVRPGDGVLFVVAGDQAKFTICPETDLFRSIPAGEEIAVAPDRPPRITVRRDAAPNSVHRYEIEAHAGGLIDPILIVHD